jgi:starvation-inducible DNA-binding protein
MTPKKHPGSQRCPVRIERIRFRTGAATVFDDLSEQIEDDRWMLRAWLNDL